MRLRAYLSIRLQQIRSLLGGVGAIFSCHRLGFRRSFRLFVARVSFFLLTVNLSQDAIISTSLQTFFDYLSISPLFGFPQGKTLEF